MINYQFDRPLVNGSYISFSDLDGTGKSLATKISEAFPSLQFQGRMADDVVVVVVVGEAISEGDLVTLTNLVEGFVPA